MPIQPLPCGSGASGDAGPDVEQVLLCDVLPGGEIAGTALAVYEYDETGNPVGAPTFVDPATGAPYVPMGVLQPCPGDIGCGAPTQFCFQSTAPVDQPGRMYDTVLTLAQGFAVQALVKDLVETPINILWEVTDPDGTAFATALQTAIQSQFPGQTVTVTPGAVDPCSGGTAGFAVHIECLRIDQTPPTLLQFKYNGGRDLIINPAFLANPPTSQFTFMKRQDGVSAVATVDVLCTNVANRGWENNDKSNAFETWGPPGSTQNVFEGTTPTPRGTVVQEINAFGSGPTPTTGGNAGNPGYGINPDTIWQTFNVPAAGNFVIKVVVGGRAATENIPIRLSTGDVGDAGIGDVINTSVNAPKVTVEGGTPAGAWTTFTQTVPLAAGLYTLAFTGPENPITTDDNAFGGLFTDMRVYQDAPGTIQAFANDDDTCTVPTTETSTICEFWAPRCSGGQIVGWYNVADGEELTNAQFWAQVPAPTCCAGSSGEGSSSVGNLVHTYLVCGTLNGERRTMSRVVVSDQAGGIIADTFVDTDGGPVTPDTWQPGDCGGDAPALGELVLCDDTGPFVRTLIQNAEGIVTSVVNLTLAGAPYVPVGQVGQCSPVFAGFVCDVFGGAPSVPAVAPTCPGSALGAPLGLGVGSGMTEGPAGTYTPTGSTNASLTWNRSPADDQHAICRVRFVNTPGTGDDPLWQLLGSFVDANGNGQGLDAVWITAIETALGVVDLSDIAPGSTATASTGGTAVTITFDGPSTHSQMWAGNGAFFVREQDGDGLAAGVTLDFDPPIRSFTLAPNVTTPTPGAFSGVQESRATPGTAAIPAQPAGVFQVKQFRRADGTSFYENLDGTEHTVLGTVGECGTFLHEPLCDSPTGVPFLRVYTVTGGAVSDFQDYDLTGAPYAVTGVAGRCRTEVADLRLVDSEVLCYTAADTTVTQFLRRYLMNQDGISVIAVLDTLLDGVTPFVTSVGGTVAVCSGDASTALCSMASSIGTICYTPPANSVPAQTITGDWVSAVQTGGPTGAPQTFTTANFGGSGRTVVVNETIGSGRAVSGHRIHLGASSGAETNTVTIDMGAPLTTVTLQFDGFGTSLGDKLRNFSPAFTSVTGAGTAVLGNTGVDPTTADGMIMVNFAGPVQNITFGWSDTAAGGTHLTSITNVVPAVVGSQTIGTAAVTVDCLTGAVGYVDLASGQPLDISTVTIVDCGTPEAECCPVVLSTALCATGDRQVTSLRLADGTVLLVDNSDGATVLPADIIECPTGCVTASSIGTVCYTPPVAVQTLQDDWAGTTSTVGGGSRVWTNSNFAGAGFTVTETVTPDTGAALLGTGVRNTATSPATQHTVIDLGAPRNNVTVRLDFFGSVQGERLRNISPAVSAVSGNATSVLAGTGADAGPAGDGTAFLLFPGPVQVISWDYAPTGGGLSGQTNISFNSGNASNSAEAAVLRNCDTGATTFVDLATGITLNPAAISIVDCPGDTAPETDPAETLTAQARLLTNAAPWTPGADVAGVLTGVSFTVLTGTATLVDSNGTVSAALPTGVTLDWQVEDANTLSPPTSMTPAAGGSVLAVWTQR